MERERRKFIIYQGIPASGKSTLAREFITGKKDWFLVNKDSIRNMRGDYWIPEQEKFIADLAIEIVGLAMDQGLNIISDDTNLNPKTIEEWKELVKFQNLTESYYYDIEYIVVKINPDEAVERDRKRERPVGEKVIRGFYERYKEMYDL